MRQHLLHCGRKIPVEAIYALRHVDCFSQLFLLVGGLCPHCHKLTMGQSGFDVWGEPVYFTPDGTPVLSHERTESPTEAVLSRIGMVSKKKHKAYQAFIADGFAQKINILPGKLAAASSRPGSVGLSEYSRRAAGRSGMDYVLSLESARAGRLATS